MKKIFVLLLLIAMFIFFDGCTKSTQQKNGKPTIAFVMKTLNNPYFIEMQKGAEEAAHRLDINLIVQAADREVDVEKQMQIIENLLQRKISALCVTPSGSKEIIPAIIKANQAGIPVLVVDTRIDNQSLKDAGAKVVTFIGSDNIDGGRIAGKFIVDKLKGKGNVVVLEGIPGHETGDARLKGFYEVINDNKGIKVIASQTANWERDQGYVVFQNILQAHHDVDAVFACNDMMALGAVEALSASNSKNKIIIVGFDAIKDSRDAISEDKMHGSIAQHPEEMGRLSVENAYKVINGEKIPAEIPVEIELITKDRLQK